VSRREAVLVDGDWLAAHLDDPEIVIAEVDERPAIYRQGHVRGAHCLDWHLDLQDPLTRDLPDPASMRALWERLGITGSSTVVFYGDRSNWYACFGFWLFRMYGLRRLKLLDGGRQAWLAEQRPLDDGPPREQPAVGAVPSGRRSQHLRATWLEVREALEGEAQLLDVRTSAEYRGDVFSEAGYSHESAQRAGHIPSALSVPWDVAVGPDGRILPDQLLRRELRERGVDLARPAITYCRIGERSSHTWFVLHELLGLTACNYDGSWTEWGSMIGMPIAVGDTPV
jgi:thiosulfate/3-mercaptopyruvate sulfurtransferase